MAGETDRWMWKASLGVTFDENEQQAILDSFDSYIRSTEDYITNKHHEFTAAVNLLFDVDGGQGLTILGSGDEYFKKVQEDLTSKSQELTEKLKDYLSDGKLEARYDVNGTLIDEPAVIEDLQRQIADVMQKVSNAEFEAQIDLIKLKFGDGNLSLETLDSFLAQLGASIQTRMETGEQAYVTIAAAAKLQFEDNQISYEEYQRQLAAAAEAYNVSIDKLSVKVENIALDIIGDAYPEVSKDQLRSALEQSIAAGIDPINWTEEQTAQFLNTEGLAEKTADGIRQSLSGVSHLLGNFGLKITPNLEVDTDSSSIKMDPSLSEKLRTSLDGLGQALEMNANVQANWELVNVGDVENQILAVVSPDEEYVIPISAFAEANWTTGGDAFNPEIISPDGEQRIPINAVAELAWASVQSQGLNPSQIVPTETEPVQTTVPVEPTIVTSGADRFDPSIVISQIPETTPPVSTTVPVNANIVLKEGNHLDSSQIVPPTTAPVQTTVPVEPTIIASSVNRFDPSIVISQIPETTAPASTTIPVNANIVLKEGNQFDTSQIVLPTTTPVQTIIPVKSTIVTSGADRFDPSIVISQIPETTPPVSTTVPVNANIVLKEGNYLDSSQIVPSTTAPVQTTVPVEPTIITSDVSKFDPSIVIPQIPTETDPVTINVPVTPSIIMKEVDSPDLSAISSQIPTETEPVQTTVPVESNVVASGGDGFDLSAITSQIPSSTESVSVNVPVAATYKANPFGGKAEDFSIASQYDFSTDTAIAPNYTVRPQFHAYKELFGIQDRYSVNTTVGVQVHYSVIKDPVPNLTSGIKKARGGLVGPNGPIGFSNGGMVRGGAQLVTVAEEGTPEMIIPLGSQRRERGIHLWKTAGHMLGVEGFANGGMIGASGRMAEPSVPPSTTTEILFLPSLLALQAQLSQLDRFASRREMSDDEDENEPRQRRSTTQPAGENAISIDVGGITIHLEVNGAEKGELDIIAAIENQKQEIADIISGAIKQAIAEVFANTPLRGGGAM